MALQKTISVKTNLNTDAVFNDAYIRVESVKIEREFGRAIVQTHKEKNGQVVAQNGYSFEYDLSGVNPISQAYVHLKSLPEFSGAVDC